MVNMRAGLPRLGTVCDEYRLGRDMYFDRLAFPITRSDYGRSAFLSVVSALGLCLLVWVAVKVRRRG